MQRLCLRSKMTAFKMAVRGMFEVGSLLLEHCLRPSIVISIRGYTRYRSKVPSRRKVGLGSFAGQISNYDTNNLDYFPATIPNIPLDGKNEYKPSKLLVVWRDKPIKGNAYWLKDIMEEVLKFGEGERGPVVVMNTPQVNQMLWHVKHLITVKPLTFPNGIPTMDDLGATYINQAGEMIINKKLKVPLSVIENPPWDEKKMDRVTLSKHLRLRWINPWST